MAAYNATEPALKRIAFTVPANNEGRPLEFYRALFALGWGA